MGKAGYKGLRIDYQPKQKVKVMLGRDWFDAEVVKANKKTVIVNTLFSRTKYRKVQIDQSIEGSLGKPKSALEPYTVSGTRVVKLPRIRVKPIEMAADIQEIKVTDLPKPEPPTTPVPQETVEEVSAPELSETTNLADFTPDPDQSEIKTAEPDELTMAMEQAEAILDDEPEARACPHCGQLTLNDPCGHCYMPLSEPKAETKPETAADVLAELEKMLE